MVQIHEIRPNIAEIEKHELVDVKVENKKGSKHEIPATIGKILSDCDISNFDMLNKFYLRSKGVIEDMNYLQGQMTHVAKEVQNSLARWEFYGDGKTHWSTIKPWLIWACLTVLAASETILSATVFSGLDFNDIERYVVAIGVVVVSTMLVKVLAISMRKLANDKDAYISVSTTETVMRLGCWILLAILLAGQYLARESFSKQSAQLLGSSSGDTWITSLSLTLLQTGIYFGVGVVIFWLTPHLRSHESELQYRKSIKKLHALHKRHQSLSSKLNCEILCLKSMWAKNIATAKSFINEHIAELGLQESSNYNDFKFSNDLLADIPDWFCKFTEPQPKDIETLINIGPQTNNEMIERAKHRNIIDRKESNEQPMPGENTQTPI